jgi:hypothetical protein
VAVAAETSADNIGNIHVVRRSVAIALAFSFLGSKAQAVDEPDLIFKRSTVFKWLSPNDKLASPFRRKAASKDGSA